MTGQGSRGTCVPLLLLAAFCLQALPLPSPDAGSLAPASWSVLVEAPDAQILGAASSVETTPATGVWLAFAGPGRSPDPRPGFAPSIFPLVPVRLSGRQATTSPALPRPPPFA